MGSTCRRAGNQPAVDLVYLVTSDFCEREAEEDPSLHLSMRWLRDHLVTSTRAGQVLLIFDCCYAGAIGQRDPSTYLGPASADRLLILVMPVLSVTTKPRRTRFALTATSALLGPSMESDEHGCL